MIPMIPNEYFIVCIAVTGLMYFIRWWVALTYYSSNTTTTPTYWVNKYVIGLSERFSENLVFLHIMLKKGQNIRPRTTICISLERAWFALQCVGIRFSIFHFIHLQLVCEKINLPEISRCKFCTNFVRP